MALFYFARHGVHFRIGELPDRRGQTAAEVRLSAFSAVEVKDMLRAARVAMLVVDACRGQPVPGLQDDWRGGGTGDAG